MTQKRRLANDFAQAAPKMPGFYAYLRKTEPGPAQAEPLVPTQVSGSPLPRSPTQVVLVLDFGGEGLGVRG